MKDSSAEKSKYVKGGRNLFQRLLVAQEGGRDNNLEMLLCHELSNTPISISDAAGSLRPCTSKADLCHILEVGVTSEALPATSLTPPHSLMDML